MAEIRPITTHIKPSGKVSLQYDSQADVDTCMDMINECIDKINEISDVLNKLETRQKNG